MRFRWTNPLRSLRRLSGPPSRPPSRSRRAARRPRVEPLECRLALAGDLVVTEIHFNPLPPGPGSVAVDNSDFEFIEIQNAGVSARQMQGVNFSDGVGFTFPASMLAPGARAVIVKNVAAFRERYGVSIPIAGTYGGVLSDGGETVTLRDASSAIIQSFTYVDTWAAAADGVGHSLVVRDPNQPLANWNLPSGWHASSRIGGSPNAADVGLYPGAIVVNELLAHQDVAPLDWVELYNTSTSAVDIDGWYLSDKPNQPMLYQIPANTTIAAGGFAVFTQQFHFGNGVNGFAFSELGDEIVVTAPLGPGGEIYGDFRQFGATDNPVSLGRYVTSTGVADFAVMSGLTRGSANTAPAVGPIVISEIMYHPSAGEDFIELHNPTLQPVKLFDPLRPTNTWKFTQGVSFTFPENVTIPAGGYLLLVDDDPATFRTTNAVPAGVPIYSFSDAFPDQTLSKAGETLELSRPGVPEPPESQQPGFVPYYTVDLVSYRDNSPWPAAADGNGPSLIRKTPLAYGNDPVNWQVGVNGGSPGRGDADLVGPRVTGVSVGGSSWTVGDVDFAVGDAAQLLPLPHTNIDRITLTFDEPVTVTATTLALSGVNVPAYALTPSVAPGVAAQSITWTLAVPIAADRLLLDLENEQTLDAAGNRLDGEWIDAGNVFPSGDGTRGGDFLFSFNVLPGDANQDGSVTMADLAAARQHAFASVGDEQFDALCDVDANGLVNVVDLIHIRNAMSTTLPAAPASPSPAVSATSPAAADAVFAAAIGAAPLARQAAMSAPTLPPTLPPTATRRIARTGTSAVLRSPSDDPSAISPGRHDDRASSRLRARRRHVAEESDVRGSASADVDLH
ncbi:MAG: lamin tail domain-containing protein [Pirellulales bacterium]